jgi:hypothetical protein
MTMRVTMAIEIADAGLLELSGVAVSTVSTFTADMRRYAATGGNSTISSQ